MDSKMTVNRNRSARHMVVTMQFVDVEFTSDASTGISDQTRPGMGIRAYFNATNGGGIGVRRGDETIEVPLGVIQRDHLRRLITFMQEFLEECEGGK